MVSIARWAALGVGSTELQTVKRLRDASGSSILPVAEADVTHRQHAIIETVFADLIDGPLAHIPSVIYS